MADDRSASGSPRPARHLPERGGTQLRTPKPVIVVDTREQNPFSFERFGDGFPESRNGRSNWRLLDCGARRYVRRRAQGPKLTWSARSTWNVPSSSRAAPHERVSRPPAGHHSFAEPGGNRATNTALRTRTNHTVAVGHAAGLRVPFLCIETHELGEEIVASYLYQVHLYHWLESNGHGRRLADDDFVTTSSSTATLYPEPLRGAGCAVS